MGLTSLFSIKYDELSQHTMIDSPVPVKPRLALIQPLQSNFRPQATLAVAEVRTAPAQRVQPRQAISGNGYDYCQCTYYAKQKRPDLPNNLGNANTWVIRARAQGIPTGSVPKVGAIGQRGMHVVYLEKVEGNRIYISELNYDYNCGFRYRWANASDFLYIY